MQLRIFNRCANTDFQQGHQNPNCHKTDTSAADFHQIQIRPNFSQIGVSSVD